MPVAIESTQANSQQTGGDGILGALTGGIGSAVGGIASTLLGTGINLIEGNPITQAQKDAEQLKQQQALDQQQLGFNEQMSDYGEQEQQKLWQGTNQLALMNEAQQQGFNPALIYGGAGGGGSTGTGAVNMGAPEAANSAAESQAENQAQANEQEAGVQAAQEANLKQQTKQSKVQTDNIAQATQLITQQTGNAAIQGIGMKLQNDYQAVMNAIQKDTQGDTESIVQQTLHNMTLDAQKLMAQTRGMDISNNTMQAAQKSIIQTYRAQLLNVITNTLKTRSDIQVNNAQIGAIIQGVQQRWDEIETQHMSINQQAQNIQDMIEANHWDKLLGAATGLVSTAIQAGDAVPPDPGTRTTTVTQGANGGVTRSETIKTPLEEGFRPR